MEPYQYSVLFLCDSCINLHLIAETLTARAKFEHIVFKSASVSPREINPVVRRVLSAAGLNDRKLKNLSINDVKPFVFDLIITVGNPIQMKKIPLPAVLPHFHWETPDPKSIEMHDRNDQPVIEAMDILKKNIDTLFNSDFLNTLFIARRHQQLILDNMLDGVMAHTEKRIVFFFNRAAERITGLKRESVLGKDCHEVFPGRFCGGACDYCNGTIMGTTPDNSRKRVEFKRRDGKIKIMEMMTLPLLDEMDKNIGALVLFKDDTDLEILKSHLKHHHTLGQLITKDPKMLDVFEQIREVAEIRAPVLIEGESGTGKELVANAIHSQSSRAKKPFVAVNCGALPEGILESELFGHVKGAFTGAVNDRKGRFELADQGTLFLDEVAELSPAMQVKLLRALQEKSFERVGGEKQVHVNIRVISATNQDLKLLMKKKKFRRDLYYRLCVVPIYLPPLRERRLDIPVLVEHFLDLVAAETERDVLGYTNETIDVLSAYSWPGNVRELRNAIEYAYVKSRDSVIKIDHLPPEILSYQRRSKKKTGPPLKIKKEKVALALTKSNGNRKEAASLLGIGRATLYRYLGLYGLK
ncbi:MAG: sigma 54-interacting transcriptional regulator [bacterium]